MDVLTQIDQDLKAAMLGGDKQKVEVLRGLKSSFQYAKAAPGNNQADLSPEAMLTVLAKESKKRQDSADLYTQGNAPDRAKAELEEKAIIDGYLPKQMDDAELAAIIDKAVAAAGDNLSPSDMGRIIGAVKQQTAGLADGARIAQAVKAKLVQ